MSKPLEIGQLVKVNEDALKYYNSVHSLNLTEIVKPIQRIGVWAHEGVLEVIPVEVYK